MEKWKSKSKGNLKMGSLLPPTKRSNNVQNPNKASQMDKRKEKKWSIGGFFKRISSKDYDSSSGDEVIVRMKKQSEREIESPRTSRGDDPPCVVLHPLENLTDATGRTKSNARIEKNNNTETFVNHSCRDSWQSKSSDGSLEGLNRKVRRHKIKARVEAKRDQLCGESSSDEDSHKSNNSLYKFSVNEEGKHHLGSKRTRTARTERYITRLSRDDGSYCNSGNGKTHSDVNPHRADGTLPPKSQLGSSASIHQRDPAKNCNPIVKKTLRFFTDYNANKTHGERKVPKEESKPPEPPPRDPQYRSFLYGYNSYPFNNRYRHVPNSLPDEIVNKKNSSKVMDCQNCNGNNEITWCGIVTTTKPRPASLSSNNSIYETMQFKNNEYNSIPRRKNHKYSCVIGAENTSLSKSYRSQSLENHSNDSNIPETFHFRDIGNNEKKSEKTVSDRKRSSENLEEALFELEAIYNSLRLGDEDLLERAERRSMEEFSHKIISEDSLKISTEDVRADTPDRIKDDMAYRRMHPKERSPAVCDQNSLSNISYLIASPILTRREMDYNGGPRRKIKNNLPDTTLDDVVFRNISRANNTLKIQEPQPPFGIPLGPVTTAPETNYLHRTPTKPEQPRSSYIPQVEPDLVTDDLAFRNLRKDAIARVGNSRNSETKSNSFGMKKKRAVRSLSANLYGLINQRQADSVPDGFSVKLQRDVHANNSGDVLFHKYWNGTERKRGFLSDTELSDVDSHRKIGNHLDINGNRASPKVYHTKLRVYVPPSNSAENYNSDSNRLSSALRKSVESSSQYSTTPEPSPSLEEEWGATSPRSPKKVTEPITEQEISTYRQLCQDLENLVKLSKVDEGETKFLTERENDRYDSSEMNDCLSDSKTFSEKKGTNEGPDDTASLNLNENLRTNDLTDRSLHKELEGLLQLEKLGESNLSRNAHSRSLSFDGEERGKDTFSKEDKDCETTVPSTNDTGVLSDTLTTGTLETDMEQLENVITPLAGDRTPEIPSRDSEKLVKETGSTNVDCCGKSVLNDNPLRPSFDADPEKIQGRENDYQENTTSATNEGEKIDRKMSHDEAQVDLIRASECDLVFYVTNRITAYFVILLAAFLASLLALSNAS